MKDLSEYARKPKHFIVHSPATGDSLAKVEEDTLDKYCYLAVPDKEKVYKQFDAYKKLLSHLGAEPIELSSLLSKSQREYMEQLHDPNLMFTRDPVITLPWDSRAFITCRFSLSSRERETTIMAKALVNLGLKSVLSFDHDEFIEGGDVLPVHLGDRRILIIGFGARTNQGAALKLAKRLIPEYVDEIIGLRHDTRVLHLDTGFTAINQQTLLVAQNMFNEGFMINESLQLEWFNPFAYAERLGFSIIYVDKEEAINHEQCNVLPLGDNTFVSFRLPVPIRDELTAKTGMKLFEIDGDELAKAAGGVHCLSRPVY